VARAVGAAEAKTHLAALLSGVFYRGERYVIERRGKPIAALVPLHDVTEPSPGDVPFNGFLSLAGGWADAEDGEIDALLSDIYKARAADRGRPVSLEE
jgi:antitoxin (DNA-binding transcriptional repressor) of toxin-antitoxin stability system